MITVVNFKNIHEHGHLLVAQFKLRYKEFIIRQGYDVKTFDEMEYDEYDSPATSYLIYRDEDGIVQGVSRLTPVTNGCMLKEIWPHIVTDKAPLSDPDVWESSRFCINSELPAKTRKHICYALAMANVEFGLMHGIKQVIGMMPTFILRTVFTRSGVHLDGLGPITDIPNFPKVQAASIPINLEQIESIREKTGLFSAITPPIPIEVRKAA